MDVYVMGILIGECKTMCNIRWEEMAYGDFFQTMMVKILDWVIVRSFLLTPKGGHLEHTMQRADLKRVSSMCQ